VIPYSAGATRAKLELLSCWNRKTAMVFESQEMHDCARLFGSRVSVEQECRQTQSGPASAEVLTSRDHFRGASHCNLSSPCFEPRKTGNFHWFCLDIPLETPREHQTPDHSVHTWHDGATTVLRMNPTSRL
jgi:hypothetical protein